MQDHRPELKHEACRGICFHPHRHPGLDPGSMMLHRFGEEWSMDMDWIPAFAGMTVEFARPAASPDRKLRHNRNAPSAQGQILGPERQARPGVGRSGRPAGGPSVARNSREAKQKTAGMTVEFESPAHPTPGDRDGWREWQKPGKAARPAAPGRSDAGRSSPPATG